MQRNKLRPRFILPALGACLLALGGCGVPPGMAAPATPSAPASAIHVLTPGRSVAVTTTQTLKLERVNDSRCKVGAVCVWAGYISYSFILSDANGATPFTLSDSMPGGSPASTLRKLTFTLLSVEPSAPPALNAPEPNYRVTVKVSSP